MRRNNSSRKSHDSVSASSFNSLYKNCRTNETVILIETESYSYNTFLQKMERLIKRNEKITEFSMSTLKKEMQIMKPEDVEMYVQQMLKEKKI